MKFSRHPLQTRVSYPETLIRIYRIEVTFPTDEVMKELLGEEWDNWDMSARPYWPKNRRYISKAAAEGRAQLFRKFGATARVVASKPVEWE